MRKSEIEIEEREKERAERKRAMYKQIEVGRESEKEKKNAWTLFFLNINL